jgi:tetratricopeptide (TPR) repeat protein
MVAPVSRRDFQAARRLAALGQLADAERIYARILAALPEHALALHNMGVAQYRQGKVGEAIATVRRALGRDLERTEHFITMAAMLRHPDHALHRAPMTEDTRALHHLGFAQYRAGEVCEAVLTLRQALSRDLSTPELFDAMAEMLEHPDYRAHLAAPFKGGPFNGQALRQAMFREIADAVQPQTIFETGAFRGTTTEFMARESAAHVFTCELDVNFFWFSQRRFRDATNITLVNLDSRTFLQRYVKLFAGTAPCFFYLDAHWDAADLPLLEELRIVLAQAPRSVAMIDDFQVWDDPGYAYDDYGPGRRLTLDYLAPLAPLGPRYFFPLASEQETGARRGSLVLTVDDATAATLAQAATLRPAPMPRAAR